MTTETAPVKVRCFPIRRAVTWQHPDPAYRSIEVTMALPFVYSRNGRYTHRVRSASIWPHDPGRGISVTAWCGQGLGTSHKGSPARLTTEIHEDRPLCGTCHGRAIGAGQIDEEGTPLIYTPRSGTPNLGNCIWEHPGAGAYGHPWRCFRAAVDRIPEAPDGYKAGVCGEHSRKWPPRVQWRYEASLANAGLELPKAVPVTARPKRPPKPEPRFEGDPELDAFDAFFEAAEANPDADIEVEWRPKPPVIIVKKRDT